MAIPNIPQNIPQPFAIHGELNNIPNTTAEKGLASWDEGFPSSTSLSIKAGATSPKKADLNGVLNILSQHAIFNQSGCVSVWNEILDYPVGAHVQLYVYDTPEAEGDSPELIGIYEYIAKKSSGPNVEDLSAGDAESPVYIGPKNPSEDVSEEYWINFTNIIEKPQGGGGIPGMVVAFSGTFGGEGNRYPIPRGTTEPDLTWVLCDGGSDGLGGTVPDLRNRMIMGAGNSYAVNSTGGSATHSHTLSGSTSSASISGTISGTVGSHTITTSEMPKHSHSITTWARESTQAYVSIGGSYRNSWSDATTNSTGGGSSHTHSLSNSSISGGSHSHTNSGSASSTTALPPYYALSYIIKVA